MALQRGGVLDYKEAPAQAARKMGSCVGQGNLAAQDEMSAYLEVCHHISSSASEGNMLNFSFGVSELSRLTVGLQKDPTNALMECKIPSILIDTLLESQSHLTLSVLSCISNLTAVSASVAGLFMRQDLSKWLIGQIHSDYSPYRSFALSCLSNFIQLEKEIPSEMIPFSFDDFCVFAKSSSEMFVVQTCVRSLEALASTPLRVSSYLSFVEYIWKRSDDDMKQLILQSIARVMQSSSSVTFSSELISIIESSLKASSEAIVCSSLKVIESIFRSGSTIQVDYKQIVCLATSARSVKIASFASICLRLMVSSSESLCEAIACGSCFRMIFDAAPRASYGTKAALESALCVIISKVAMETLSDLIQKMDTNIILNGFFEVFRDLIEMETYEGAKAVFDALYSLFSLYDASVGISCLVEPLQSIFPGAEIKSYSDVDDEGVRQAASAFISRFFTEED